MGVYGSMRMNITIPILSLTLRGVPPEFLYKLARTNISDVFSP